MYVMWVHMDTRLTSLSVVGNCELHVQYAADIIISIKHISPDIYFARIFYISLYMSRIRWTFNINNR